MVIGISLFALLHLFLAILSYFKIRNSNDKTGFIYQWGFLFGAFVWEDLFLISSFTFLACIFILAVRDIRIGLLIFTIFWVVRCTGESIYFFFQQFIQPKFMPHAIGPHLDTNLRTIFGKISNQKAYMLMQVFYQLLAVVALCFFVFLIKNWQMLGRGF